jgi:hypothetical protein
MKVAALAKLEVPSELVREARPPRARLDG